MKKLLASIALIPTFLLATQLTDFIDTKKCDQIIDKQLYQICYSYKYKGALAGWIRLDGKLVNSPNDIKKRPRFYDESSLPIQYRSKHSDYKGDAEHWSRGHFVVGDADIDYDEKALLKAYTMANIIPQSAPLNQKTWIKVENYGRMLARKLGYINSISIASYNNPPQKIKNNVAIPATLYRIYYNNDTKFEKCFKYDNLLDVDSKNDKLRDHEISCNSLKLKK